MRAYGRSKGGKGEILIPLLSGSINGMNDEALVAYERALRLDPNDACAHNGKGIALFDLKLLDEAFASFERAIQL